MYVIERHNAELRYELECFVLHQKKDTSTGVGRSILQDETEPAPKVTGKTRKRKSSPANIEHSILNKIGTNPACI